MASMDFGPQEVSRRIRRPFGETHSVPAVEKTLSILEALTGSKTGLSVRELAKLCGLPKSSVHCILVTLQRLEYLCHDQRTSRYLFSRKFLRLADGALGSLELREWVEPHLQALASRTGLTAHLGILEFDEAVIVAKASPSGSASRVASWAGKRVGLHCTGLGKALIAGWPPLELERLLRERGLPRHNDNTLSSLRRLNDELEKVRRAGYAIDDEESMLGLRCVGTPVYDPGGRVLAALSVAGSLEEITADNAGLVAAEIKTAALELSRSLAVNCLSWA